MKQRKVDQQKNRKVTVRFSEAEYRKMERSYQQTSKRKLSEYVRAVLLEKPVTVYTRSKSLDDGLAVLKDLNYQLSAIGNNLNQAVKRLHLLEHVPQVLSWAKSAEQVYAEVKLQQEKLDKHLQSIFREWLRE